MKIIYFVSVLFASNKINMIKITNLYRKMHGKPPLKIIEPLRLASELQVNTMCKELKLTHKNPSANKSTLRDRLNFFNFKGLNIGENIAKQQNNDFKEVFKVWVKSKLHRKNILGNYDFTGVATCIGKDKNRYWVQVFARGSGNWKGSPYNKNNNQQNSQEANFENQPNNLNINSGDYNNTKESNFNNNKFYEAVHNNLAQKNNGHSNDKKQQNVHFLGQNGMQNHENFLGGNDNTNETNQNKNEGNTKQNKNVDPYYNQNNFDEQRKTSDNNFKNPRQDFDNIHNDCDNIPYNNYNNNQNSPYFNNPNYKSDNNLESNGQNTGIDDNNKTSDQSSIGQADPKIGNNPQENGFPSNQNNGKAGEQNSSSGYRHNQNSSNNNYGSNPADNTSSGPSRLPDTAQDSSNTKNKDNGKEVPCLDGDIIFLLKDTENVNSIRKAIPKDYTLQFNGLYKKYVALQSKQKDKSHKFPDKSNENDKFGMTSSHDDHQKPITSQKMSSDATEQLKMLNKQLLNFFKKKSSGEKVEEALRKILNKLDIIANKKEDCKTKCDDSNRSNTKDKSGDNAKDKKNASEKNKTEKPDSKNEKSNKDNKKLIDFINDKKNVRNEIDNVKQMKEDGNMKDANGDSGDKKDEKKDSGDKKDEKKDSGDKKDEKKDSGGKKDEKKDSGGKKDDKASSSQKPKETNKDPQTSQTTDTPSDPQTSQGNNKDPNSSITDSVSKSPKNVTVTKTVMETVYNYQTTNQQNSVSLSKQPDKSSKTKDDAITMTISLDSDSKNAIKSKKLQSLISQLAKKDDDSTSLDEYIQELAKNSKDDEKNIDIGDPEFIEE